MRRYALLAVIALLAACGQPSRIQQGAPIAPGQQLMAGLGGDHHPITTSNPEAQEFFDQGFALTYAFNHEAAVRSFRHAAEIDPQAPMPYWGIAWATGPNYNLDIDDSREKQAYGVGKCANDPSACHRRSRCASGVGAREEAIALWTKAVAAADRVPYDEPPIWFYPVRESLDAALVLADQASEAERVFRADLERHPRNPRSLLGLRESLLKQGKDADAAWVQQAFEDAWKNADVAITLDSL
jgi:tetratricopeptide (TPR) repeat protein